MNFLKNNMKKRGISPVVATVLLIAIVVVLGMIIFLWFRGMVDEAVIKFDQNADLVCEKVDIEGSYNGEELIISNLGNTPVYNIKMKIYSAGGNQLIDLKESSDQWPSNGLNSGGIFVDSMEYSDIERLELIPVLLGMSDGEQATYVCDDSDSYKVI